MSAIGVSRGKLDEFGGMERGRMEDNVHVYKAPGGRLLELDGFHQRTAVT